MDNLLFSNINSFNNNRGRVVFHIYQQIDDGLDILYFRRLFYFGRILRSDDNNWHYFWNRAVAMSIDTKFFE
jgi:hypothetical protein